MLLDTSGCTLIARRERKRYVYIYRFADNLSTTCSYLVALTLACLSFISITRTHTICSEFVAIKKTLVAIFRYTQYIFLLHISPWSRLYREPHSPCTDKSDPALKGRRDLYSLAAKASIVRSLVCKRNIIMAVAAAARRCTYVYLHNLNGIFCSFVVDFCLLYGFIMGLAV